MLYYGILYICKVELNLIIMSGYTVNIETLTPEIKKLMEQLGSHSGVTITPNKGANVKSTDTWERALAEGAVSVDTFFDELNSRVEKWPDTRA